MNKLYIFCLILITSISYAQVEKEEVQVIEQEVIEEPPVRINKQQPTNFYNSTDPESWVNNYGLIKRLYPSTDGFYFSLKGGSTAMNPKSGYYKISLDHENYDALVDVLLMAACKSQILKVRTEPKLNKKGIAEVRYLVLDY